MQKRTQRHARCGSRNLILPELEQASSAVLNSLGSPQSQRTYGRAMAQFIFWYCSEPRLALSRAVVLRHRLKLENGRSAKSRGPSELAPVRTFRRSRLAAPAPFMRALV